MLRSRVGLGWASNRAGAIATGGTSSQLDNSMSLSSPYPASLAVADAVRPRDGEAGFA